MVGTETEKFLVSLKLNIPVNNFSVMLGWARPPRPTKTEKYLVSDKNAAEHP